MGWFNHQLEELVTSIQHLSQVRDQKRSAKSFFPHGENWQMDFCRIFGTIRLKGHPQVLSKNTPQVKGLCFQFLLS